MRNMRQLFRIAVTTALLSVTTVTQAVNVSPDGTGEVLIYPYYTTRNGNVTLLSVVNNDAQGKAVKIRFREGRNGVDVLDLNLFLSREDAWTGAVINDPNGGSRLISTDESCTSPTIPPEGLVFQSGGYQGDDASLRSLDRANEGYLEAFEMASIVPNSAIDRDVRDKRIPRDCKLTSNASIEARASDFGPLRGRLSGSGTLVSSSMSTGYSAIALQGLHIPAVATATGGPLPNLASGNSKAATFIEATPKRTYAVFAEFDRSIDAVSAVLMQNAIRGEFSRESGFVTDFVMTFPTKYWYVNRDTASPFTSRWDPPTGEACEIPRGGGPMFSDREGFTTDPFGNAPPDIRLCFSTTTISFSSRGNGSPLGSGLDAPFIRILRVEPTTFEPRSGTAVLAFGRANGEPNLQSNSNSRVLITESGVATREITGVIKFVGLPVIGIGIASAQFPNSKDNFNSSYVLTGGRTLPE
jgi:hypothetical protein